MKVYFPVLRWKKGERDALANLKPEVKDVIVPIIEFPYGCDCFDKKFTEFYKTAANDWGTNRPFYIDLSTVDYTEAPPETEHPVLIFLKATYEANLDAIPILRLDIEPELLNIISKAYTDHLFHNIALRITEDEDDTAPDYATQMLNSLGIEKTSVDLIIDLRNVSDGHVQAKLRVLRDLAHQFGREYRKRILISGAIPRELEIETDGQSFLPRYEWLLWRQAIQKEDLSDLLFGDYTTVVVDFVEIPYLGAPKTKYTLTESWFVQKGHKPRGKDDQRQRQSQTVVNSNFFRGENSSFGEYRINQCASGSWGPGNATNWVTIDVNQHITFVVSQVSSILGAP